MSQESKSQEWSRKSWNPVTGCTKVSPACANCYAETTAKWIAGLGTTDKYPKDDPFRPIVHTELLKSPPKFTKPNTRVFVNSMSDTFHDIVTDDQIRLIHEVAKHSPNAQFQFLTKRIERAARFYAKNPDCLYPNVWVGTTIEDQKRLSERLPHLLKISAPVLFVSMEPLLEAVRLPKKALETLDWLVVGGESGRQPRPMEADWVRAIRDQCAPYGIPIFVKQMSGKTKKVRHDIPKDINIRHFPKVGA